MKITHFLETDTLYIELCPSEVSETRDLDENTLLDLETPVRHNHRTRQRTHGHPRLHIRASPRIELVVQQH